MMYNQPAPAAFYYQAVARKENSFDDWMNAGNHFNDAYKGTQDTSVQPAFVANAIEAFKNAVKLKPENLDAKTGLGIAYVNQTARVLPTRTAVRRCRVLCCCLM